MMQQKNFFATLLVVWLLQACLVGFGNPPPPKTFFALCFRFTLALHFFYLPPPTNDNYAGGRRHTGAGTTADVCSSGCFYTSLCDALQNVVVEDVVLVHPGNYTEAGCQLNASITLTYVRERPRSLCLLLCACVACIVSRPRARTNHRRGCF
jgi:hypothetical protein